MILVSIIGTSYIYGYREIKRELINESNMIDMNPGMREVIRNDIFPIRLPTKRNGGHGRGPREVVIFDSNKNIIKNDFIDLDSDSVNILHGSIDKEIIDIEIDENKYLVIRKNLDGTTLFFFKDLTPLKSFHFTLITIAILGSLFGFIIIFLLARYLAHITIEPIREQSRELEAYSHNVAHELRTPLSIMRSNLELLNIKITNIHNTIVVGISQKQEVQGRENFSKLSPAQRDNQKKSFFNEEIRSFSDIQRFISSTDEEITTMERIIESLLFLAKPSKGDIQEEINITKKTEEIIEKYKDENSIKYIHDKKHLLQKISEELYSRILCNLLENAIKYKSEGEILVQLSKNKIIISNSISHNLNEIEQNNLTKAFYQGDQSRNTSGYGLGLALVAKIVEISGWTLVITTKNKQFIVEIRF